jgi:hypothetical protein
MYYTALMLMGKRKRDRQPVMWVTGAAGPLDELAADLVNDKSVL